MGQGTGSMPILHLADKIRQNSDGGSTVQKFEVVADELFRDIRCIS